MLTHAIRPWDKLSTPIRESLLVTVRNHPGIPLLELVRIARADSKHYFEEREVMEIADDLVVTGALRYEYPDADNTYPEGAHVHAMGREHTHIVDDS